MTATNSTITDERASAAGLFAFDSSTQRAYTARSSEGLDINPTTTDASTRQGDYGLLLYEHEGAVIAQGTRSLTATGFDLSFSTSTTAIFTALGIGLASITSPHTENLGLSESCLLILRREIPVTDNIGIAESCVTVLADGLAPLGLHGTVLDNGPEAGAVLQADIVVPHAWVAGNFAAAGTVLQADITVERATIYG
jgi:hypothetical protein